MKHTPEDVFDIIAEWLEKNGYDGLASDDCGCGRENLFCCPGDSCTGCQPAIAHKLTKEEIESGSLSDGTPFGWDGDPDVGDILYLSGKPGHKNTCSGMSDPAEEIKALREALEMFVSKGQTETSILKARAALSTASKLTEQTTGGK